MAFFVVVLVVFIIAVMVFIVVVVVVFVVAVFVVFIVVASLWFFIVVELGQPLVHQRNGQIEGTSADHEPMCRISQQSESE